MKLETSFNNFLKNIVNLNETRYQTAKSGIETITSVLQNDELLGDKFIDTVPQGSFRQETIIKPVDADMDFDVDILFEINVVEGWEPADYLNKLSAQLKKLDRYKDKVDTRGKTRCVTIDYESNFHIDIVPSIQLGTGSVVMNKATNQYEPTDGDGYSQWFSRQSAITGKKHLVKVVRLLKYIRDLKGQFDVKSVFLTTLIGNQVLPTDNSTNYPDTPTSFVLLLSRLDAYLQSNPSAPIVVNPVLPSENFNRHLDYTKYSEFRNAIHSYSQQAIDAYNEPDEAKSLKKWQKIFGDSFTGAVQETSLAISINGNGLQLADSSHKQNLSDLHILSQNSSATVRIEAGLYWGRSNDRAMNRRHKGSFSPKTELPRFHWLKYKAITTYDKPYGVYWQVVNTGENAGRNNGLRGEIKLGTNDQWERSLYTGVHWIECFIVDHSSNTCVCRSGPFYVGFRERSDDVPD